jgi:hypothetical protein
MWLGTHRRRQLQATHVPSCQSKQFAGRTCILLEHCSYYYPAHLHTQAILTGAMIYMQQHACNTCFEGFSGLPLDADRARCGPRSASQRSGGDRNTRRLFNVLNITIQHVPARFLRHTCSSVKAWRRSPPAVGLLSICYSMRIREQLAAEGGGTDRLPQPAPAAPAAAAAVSQEQVPLQHGARTAALKQVALQMCMLVHTLPAAQPACFRWHRPPVVQWACASNLHVRLPLCRCGVEPGKLTGEGADIVLSSFLSLYPSSCTSGSSREWQ